MPLRSQVAAALAVLGCAAAALLVVESRSSPHDGRSALAEDEHLPAPVKPAFSVRTPRPLRGASARAHWTPVLETVAARRSGEARAPVVTTLQPTTPEGTANIVLVLGHAEDAERHVWVHVRLPVLPNGRTGWVPRLALGGYEQVRTHLVVDGASLTATLLRDGRPVFRAPVGVGKARSPTPKGEFYIRNRLTQFASATYGPLAFGTSARSAVLTDWPAGGFVGIHGTDRPDLLPGRVSHGCIRLRNADILRLARLMPVGTPLTIR